MDSYLKLLGKGLLASYKVAFMLAESKKAHAEAEGVIALALVVIAMPGAANAGKVSKFH